MILDKIIDLICSELGFERDALCESTALDLLVGDELEAAELAMAIESEFGVELSGAIAYDSGETVLSLAKTVEELAS